MQATSFATFQCTLDVFRDHVGPIPATTPAQTGAGGESIPIPGVIINGKPTPNDTSKTGQGEAGA